MIKYPGEPASHRGPIEYARAMALQILTDYGGPRPEEVLARWVGDRYRIMPEQAQTLARREMRLARVSLSRGAGIRSLGLVGGRFVDLDRPPGELRAVQGPMRLDWRPRPAT